MACKQEKSNMEYEASVAPLDSLGPRMQKETKNTKGGNRTYLKNCWFLEAVVSVMLGLGSFCLTILKRDRCVRGRSTINSRVLQRDQLRDMD